MPAISYEEMLEQASLGAKVLADPLGGTCHGVQGALAGKIESFEAPDSPNQNKPDGSRAGNNRLR